jgi:DNA-binding transcriptional MerR regulator
VLIGEVARRSGVSTRMLRHYDALGLVRPTGRTVGGYRRYSADDVRRIFAVEGLRSLGLSLRQVERALQDPAVTPAALVADLVRSTEERIAREQELLERLRAVDASAPTGWRGVLRIVELLQGLGSASAARRQRAALTRPEGASVPTGPLARAVLAESDPVVAGALRWALGRSGGDDGVATLAEGARAQDAEVRRRAVRALAGMPGAPGAAEVLAGALADPDAAVRRHAALASGRLGATAAVPVLVGMVVDGDHDVDAAEVLAALSRDPARGEEVLDALVAELAAPAADTATRIRLTQALVELPGEAPVDVLRRLAADDDRAVALVASALTRAPTRAPGPRSPDRAGA